MNRLVPFALTLVLATVLADMAPAQDGKDKSAPDTKALDDTKKAVLKLSKDKWGWMSERKIVSLDDLFHPEAVFVHMGGSMTRMQEDGKWLLAQLSFSRLLGS